MEGTNNNYLDGFKVSTGQRVYCLAYGWGEIVTARDGVLHIKFPQYDNPIAYSNGVRNGFKGRTLYVRPPLIYVLQDDTFTAQRVSNLVDTVLYLLQDAVGEANG